MFIGIEKTMFDQLDERNINKGLLGSSIAIKIAEGFNERKTHLIVCKNNDQAEKIAMDLKASSSDEVIFFPETETLAYDLESPHASLRGARSEAIYKLLNEGKGRRRFFVSSLDNIARKVSGISYWNSAFLKLKKGANISVEEINNFLLSKGYSKERLDTSGPGEFTIHNSVVDIFATNQNVPVRIYLENSKIESIHRISIEDQRNEEEIDSILIAPSYEIPIEKSDLGRVRSFIRTSENFSSDDPIFRSLSNEEIPLGIEYYLPEITSDTEAVWNFIPPSIEGERVAVDIKLENFGYWERANHRYDEITNESKRTINSPESLWVRPEDIIEDFDKSVFLNTNKNHTSVISENAVERQPDLQSTIDLLNKKIDSSKRVLVSVGSEGRKQEVESIADMMGLDYSSIGYLEEFNKEKNPIVVLTKPISSGFEIEGTVCVVSEKELFGNTSNDGSYRVVTKTSDFTRIQDLETLSIGDPLVHLEYGVGRYAGLEIVNMGSREEEMLKIRYAEDATAFVAMDELYLVTRHGGLTEEKVPLDIMQSKKWKKSLNHAVREIQSTAKSLIELKREREKIKGVQCKRPSWRYHRFCNGFSFDLTPDQATSIDDVVKDLTKSQPMDRLIVGDVGFGKTEVAMRGAFHAADNGFHVMVVAPTKVLAHQHFESFKERFQDSNIDIEFIEGSNPSEKKRAERILGNKSKPCVLIGTHTLLRVKDFIHQIGLIVIDEEHRFGTSDKELLSDLHGQINVLNMTATPIPRTLSLSLNGIRDISIIATPPSKRLSIRTMVSEPSDKTYREAIEREQMRDGQVYVLHNDIENLDNRVKYLKGLFPDLTIGVLHGRMKANDQTKVLGDFTRKKIDILVCTTIIETGIDIPTANTILIEKPDRIGLSQLHQLRGRVGRSHHQAYCYLVEKEENIGNTARKRFDALIKAKNLGDGFLLANHDLEIRGAGELLGEKQSGEIHKIGFTLYSKLLRRAIDMIEKHKDLYRLLDREMKVELSLSASGLLEPSFIYEPPLRLAFYKKLSSADSLVEIDRVQKDMSERFGELPEKAKILCLISKIRVYARSLGLKKIVAEETRGFIEARHKDLNHDLDIALEDVTFSHQEKGSGFEFYYPMSRTDKRFGVLVNIMKSFSKKQESTTPA